MYSLFSFSPILPIFKKSMLGFTGSNFNRPGFETLKKDIKYIEEMLPNISLDVTRKIKVLQPGTCVAFGTAFKIPMICKLEMPNPRPFSSSCNVSAYWDSELKDMNDFENNEIESLESKQENVGMVETIQAEILEV